MSLKHPKNVFKYKKRLYSHVKKILQKNLVCLCWSGYYTPHTLQREPTTARRGHFELLGFPPGPNRVSLVNLAPPGSPRGAILTPGLVRTPVQRETRCSRTPVLKPSSNSDLPVAEITGHATAPVENRGKV